MPFLMYAGIVVASFVFPYYGAWWMYHHHAPKQYTDINHYGYIIIAYNLYLLPVALALWHKFPEYLAAFLVPFLDRMTYRAGYQFVTIAHVGLEADARIDLRNVTNRPTGPRARSAKRGYLG
jgi:hypothetical protein